jgi:hypothetical protein
MDELTVAPGFEFDLEHFTMAEKFQYQKATEEDSVPFLVKVVKKWPYEGLDPANPADYGRLTQDQYDMVNRQFFRSIQDRRTSRKA